MHRRGISRSVCEQERHLVAELSTGADSVREKAADSGGDDGDACARMPLRCEAAVREGAAGAVRLGPWQHGTGDDMR